MDKCNKKTCPSYSRTQNNNCEGFLKVEACSQSKPEKTYTESEVNELLKGKDSEIEFRPHIDNIDEIVAKNVDIHLEFMDDTLIWMSVSKGKKLFHLNFTTKDPKCKKHLTVSAENVSAEPDKGEI